MSALKKCGKGFDPYIYHTENMGKQLGERHRFLESFYGDASEKAGTEGGSAAVYSDTHRYWISDAESVENL